MQPGSLRKKCPFQDALFLEVEGTNQWKVIRSRSPEVFRKKGALRNFANSQENTCARVSFLIQLQASASIFYRTPQVAASELSYDE